MNRYYLKQKLVGVGLLIVTALSIPILDGDATIALITVPMGLIMLTTKEKVIY